MRKVWDVVCGMDVDPDASPSTEYQGKTFYFCCNGCRGAFIRSPDFHLRMWADDRPGVDPSPPEADDEEAALGQEDAPGSVD